MDICHHTAREEIKGDPKLNFPRGTQWFFFSSIFLAVAAHVLNKLLFVSVVKPPVPVVGLSRQMSGEAEMGNVPPRRALWPAVLWVYSDYCSLCMDSTLFLASFLRGVSCMLYMYFPLKKKQKNIFPIEKGSWGRTYRKICLFFSSIVLWYILGY